MKDTKKKFALVTNGETLGFISENNLEETFRTVCLACEAVLCCRLSPAQKAYVIPSYVKTTILVYYSFLYIFILKVVKIIKRSKKKPITAAIGDGANDVSMIQEAHVGVGIYGKEGNSAAKSSDFCFAKFKFLRRLFVNHGYLYYNRTAVLIQYFFYKV